MNRVDPFAKDSPLKAMPVLAFPADFFFVLRVLQILRCQFASYKTINMLYEKSFCHRSMEKRPLAQKLQLALS